MPMEPGLRFDLPFEVSEDLVTDVAGSISQRVLATPRMIGMMERTCMKAVWSDLPEGATCVGYEVNVKHVASAPYGGKCVCTAELIEVVDGRKLRFHVEVKYDGRTVGVGTHERRLIDSTEFDGRNRGRKA
jgi:fluoroacetyl-CoA thioesterase